MKNPKMCCVVVGMLVSLGGVQGVAQAKAAKPHAAKKAAPVSPEWTAPAGGTIFDAAWKGDLAGVQRLLARNPKLLESKAKNGKTHVAKKLDVTPLGFATVKGRLSVVKYLVGKGAQVNVPAGVYPPLMAAVDGIQSQAAKYLVAHGANLNADNGQDMTVLIAAAGGGFGNSRSERDNANSISLVKWLIDKGAKVNGHAKHGPTLLELVLAGIEPDFIRYLISKGADVNTVDLQGNSPLTFAARSGDVKFVREVLDKGADVNGTRRIQAPAGFEEEDHDTQTALDSSSVPAIDALLRAHGGLYSNEISLLKKGDIGFYGTISALDLARKSMTVNAFFSALPSGKSTVFAAPTPERVRFNAETAFVTSEESYLGAAKETDLKIGATVFVVAKNPAAGGDFTAIQVAVAGKVNLIDNSPPSS